MSLRLVFALLAGLMSMDRAGAASFNCWDYGLSEIEALVCSDEHLSRTDELLEEAYRETLLGTSGRAARAELVVQQRAWLAGVRNNCADTHCLEEAYRNRAQSFGPLADADVSCDEMRRFPKQVFKYGLDLGSGYGSSTEFDYECPDSVSSLPFMARVLGIAEAVRGQDGPSHCTGSIVYAHRRYYLYALARAGIAPTLPIENWKQEGRPSTDTYFRQWAEESPHNFQLYRAFIDARADAEQKLTRHFIRRGLSRPQARTAAADALNIVLDRAAGSFPSAIVKAVPPIVEKIRQSTSSPGQVRQALSESTPEANEMMWALRVALLERRSEGTIASLVGHVKPEWLESSLTPEPLLAFAIGQPAALKRLIEAGAPVDAENEFGKTALFYAIAENDHRTVLFLLEHGADVNHAYRSKRELEEWDLGCRYPSLQHARRTPLMHAAANGDPAMLDVLLKHGAERDAIDEIGFNALDYAKQSANGVTAKHLQALGLVPTR